MANSKRGSAVAFPNSMNLHPALVVHYGEKPMETWAASVFGPLANHIDSETSAQYGIARAETWYAMVVESLAAKLDAAAG